MTLPRISLVIPSYNKVAFIGQTLHSIFNQKYPNLEVIIQDGGSIDGTLDVIRKYASEYPKIIKYESRKDNGQLDAVNKGLKTATGEILTFINSDDCYMQGALSAVSRAYMKNPNALWIAGRGIVVNEKGMEIAKPVTLYKNLLFALNSYFLLLTSNYLMQPSVFFTKRAYKKYGPFSGTPDFITEYDFWLKLGLVSMPVIINTNLSEFRIEPSTKTKRMFKELLFEDFRIVKKYTKNPFVLLLHQINNMGRVIVGRFV